MAEQAGPGSRPLAGSGRGRRDAILAAAVALLGRDGPAGFSAAALAREAGVSKANIFHHFPSVEAIALDAFGRLAASMKMLAPPAGLAFEDWLAGLGEETLALVLARRGFLNAWFGFVARAPFEPALGDRLRASLTDTRAVVASIVAERHPGRPGAAECDRLAGLIVMSLDGLALHLMVFPDRIEATRAAWAEFVALVAAGDTR